MRAGFLRHLELCRQFYRNGFGGPWWDEQVAALDAHRLAAFAGPVDRYRLRNFDLERAS
jgi:hypothetical protein